MTWINSLPGGRIGTVGPSTVNANLLCIWLPWAHLPLFPVTVQRQLMHAKPSLRHGSAPGQKSGWISIASAKVRENYRGLLICEGWKVAASDTRLQPYCVHFNQQHHSCYILMCLWWLCSTFSQDKHYFSRCGIYLWTISCLFFIPLFILLFQLWLNSPPQIVIHPFIIDTSHLCKITDMYRNS